MPALTPSQLTSIKAGVLSNLDVNPAIISDELNKQLQNQKKNLDVLDLYIAQQESNKQWWNEQNNEILENLEILEYFEQLSEKPAKSAQSTSATSVETQNEDLSKLTNEQAIAFYKKQLADLSSQIESIKTEIKNAPAGESYKNIEQQSRDASEKLSNIKNNVKQNTKLNKTEQLELENSIEQVEEKFEATRNIGARTIRAQQLREESVTQVTTGIKPPAPQPSATKPKEEVVDYSSIKVNPEQRVVMELVLVFTVKALTNIAKNGGKLSKEDQDVMNSLQQEAQRNLNSLRQHGVVISPMLSQKMMQLEQLQLQYVQTVAMFTKQQRL